MAQVAYSSNYDSKAYSKKTIYGNVVDLPFFTTPTTMSPKEHDPLKIYSRALRQTRMEDLDDGTGRMVSGKQHLPRGPIASTITAVREKPLHDECIGRLLSTTDTQYLKPPSSHIAEKTCRDAWATQHAAIDGPCVASKRDVEMVDSLEAYIQYPECHLQPQEEPPLAYLAFADSAPEIGQQPCLGILQGVNPWDVQMNMDPPTFRGRPLPMPRPSGMSSPAEAKVGAGKPVKKTVNATKKRTVAGVKKVKIVAPLNKAGRKKTTI